MDEESLAANDVRKKDFDAPTLEDKFDKESLPAVLQVKKFGFRGRTKYTHLLDQDTTVPKLPPNKAGGAGSIVMGSAGPGAGSGSGAGPLVPRDFVMRPQAELQAKYMQKRSGVGDIDTAGRLHKKSKTS